MRILALCSLSDAPNWRKDNTTSPVDQWRIVRPYMNLKEKYGWTVDFDKVIIPDFSKDMEITEDTYKQVYDRVAGYDMVVSSYFTNGSMYSLINVVCEKLGVPFVIDVDDDWFDIPEDNPVWNKLTQLQWANIMVMLEDVRFVTTTNDHLAGKIVAHRTEKDPNTVVVIPNMISTSEYEHPPIDNGDKIIIGWAGGSSHYRDFHETNVLPAIRRIMHEHKNVELHVCGMVVDEYIPKKRLKTYEPQRGLKWLDLYRELSFDIGIAPLLGREFDKSKSNIKWQEYSLMGAAFVGTNVGPYKTVRNGLNGLLVNNTEQEWYEALKKLVTDEAYRKSLAKAAKESVSESWSIENNLDKLKNRVEYICGI